MFVDNTISFDYLCLCRIESNKAYNQSFINRVNQVTYA